MNIVILAGGLSPEREVSLSSGQRIANALIERGHRVLLLDVYVGYPEPLEDPMRLFTDTPIPEYRIPACPPDPETLRQRLGEGEALIGPNVLLLCRLADRVFLALHGGMGENGQLQATLDLHGIPYTGTGYLGSALAMDKEISKRIFESVGVPTPPWLVCKTSDADPGEIARCLGFPLVIKPIDSGSSVGVRMADDAEQLADALHRSVAYGERVLIERRIRGRELAVGILADEVLPAVEILPKEGFYDYANKYGGATEEICPAPLSPEVAARAAELARLGFAALRLRHYARFDFMLDAEGELWCLEANTLPGMTPTSLLPQAAAAAGIDYPTLCERIVLGS